MSDPRNGHYAITSGTTFDTPFESGCVATTDSDQHGNFTATDSDGVECQFNTTMISTTTEENR